MYIQQYGRISPKSGNTKVVLTAHSVSAPAKGIIRFTETFTIDRSVSDANDVLSAYAGVIADLNNQKVLSNAAQGDLTDTTNNKAALQSALDAEAKL